MITFHSFTNFTAFSRHTIKGYGSAFGEKYGNADRVEVACAALVRHGYSYVGKVRYVNVNVLKVYSFSYSYLHSYSL